MVLNSNSTLNQAHVVLWVLSIRLVLKHILKGKRDTRGEFCSLNVFQCLTAIIYSTKTFAKAAYGINKKDSNLFMELFWYVAKQLSLTSDKWKHIVLGWNTSKMIKSINEMKFRLYSFKKKCCSMLIRIKKIFVFHSAEYHDSTATPLGNFPRNLSFPATVQEHSRYIWKTLHTWLDPTQLVVCNSWNSFKLLHYPAWKKKHTTKEFTHN